MYLLAQWCVAQLPARETWANWCMGLMAFEWTIRRGWIESVTNKRVFVVSEGMKMNWRRGVEHRWGTGKDCRFCMEWLPGVWLIDARSGWQTDDEVLGVRIAGAVSMMDWWVHCSATRLMRRSTPRS